jgi:hypothetical protein
MMDDDDNELEPEYIKLYIKDLGGLCGLTAGETKILLQIAGMTNRHGVIALPAGIKAIIAESVGYKQAVINNALTKFCNPSINVMKRTGVGVYELNPDYFARGKWHEIKERRKAFYAKTTYTPDGIRTIETGVVDEQSDSVKLQK